MAYRHKGFYGIQARLILHNSHSDSVFGAYYVSASLFLVKLRRIICLDLLLEHCANKLWAFKRIGNPGTTQLAVPNAERDEISSEPGYALVVAD